MKTLGYAVCIWLGLFAFCMVAIGPGWVGGPLMAADRSPQITDRGTFHGLKGNPGYVTFNAPAGWTKTGHPYATRHGTHESIVIPYSDIQGQSHTVVITDPDNPTAASLELDPQGVK